MGVAERYQTTAGRPASDDRETVRRSAEWIAELMDTAIRIPGTNIRIGLDPLIGLIPGIGDAIAGAIGSTLLVLAHRVGVPRIVQVRMALNVVINAVLGALPGLGDLFSAWFKSNVRNARLLRKHAASAPPSTVVDWGFVAGLIVLILAAIGIGLAGAIWLVHWIWQTASGISAP